MAGYDRRLRLLAVCLSAVSGYVDAIGFMKLSGFFVSFMSGNTTLAGVRLAQGKATAAVAGGLIALFVLGVMMGAGVGRWSKTKRRPVVLALVSFLLGLAAIATGFGLDRFAIFCMVLAMGAVNAVFAEGGEVHIGVTYMTGTLVKLGKRIIAAAFFGGDPMGWVPYLFLWLGLSAGAFLGATAYQHFGLTALWGAAIAAMICTCVAAKMGPDQSQTT
jgi:uncharacterized membrane protein YoaK (UPF0700 family)